MPEEQKDLKKQTDPHEGSIRTFTPDFRICYLSGLERGYNWKNGGDIVVDRVH